MKKALITGITGQDGSYLTELLLEKVYPACPVATCPAYPEFREETEVYQG